MITILRYAASVLIWGVIAAFLLLTGKIVYLTFWAILGAILILLWVGHLIYHIMFLFNPDFKPIKIVFFMVVILGIGLIYFKVFVAPGWNRWGSTPEEIEAEYRVDSYCGDADLRTVRTLEVNVPREYIFRWVRQLPEAASYGEDLIDFRGKERFKRLLDNLPELKEGDEFLIGKIVEYKEGEGITFDIGADPKFPKMGINCMFGGYYFKDAGDNKTRINMVMRADYDGFIGWFYSQVIIEIGDFLVTTKQIGKIKEAAEKQFGDQRQL
ncbi:MAG: hypothetical protein V3W18_13535 [candidate division Zixibacteria bacterium]